MSTNAADNLRPITSLWWLPALFGVVTFGVGVFFVVSPHETLSTFTVIAGIFLLFDGVLAINCWRHLDTAPLATDMALYSRAQRQIDVALLRGLALILRERISNLTCSTGDVQKAHLAFVNTLAPFLDRAARAIEPAKADTLKTQTSMTDASQVDVTMAVAALDGLFACP